jgi:hypothetical protein
MLAEGMERKGYGDLSRSTEVSAEMYDKLSRAGHNRRSAALDAWWPQGRRMAYGPHWSAIRRAAYVRLVGLNLSGLVGVAGDALRRMLPPGTWEAQWAPLRDSVDAMNALAPLDVASIRRAAGTG